ncbi:hypothetical protein KKF61_02445 [Patescibacteria group bacterium]|nr:hypothetical protein [Patescibacteria group bacterium]MBU0963562.1 hypothetical protein [Patescibacteria group bacterium]
MTSLQNLSKKSALIILVIIIGILIVGGFYLINPSKVSNQNIENSNNKVTNLVNKTVESDRDYEYSVSGSVGKLSFPYSDFSIQVPISFFTLSDQEIDQYSIVDGEYYLWNACRIFYKDSGKGAALWVSYAEQNELCGTERSLSLLSESVFQSVGSYFCSVAEKSAQYIYAGCEIINNPPQGFTGYSFYEYVPDYGVENSGTIVREVFLYDNNSGENKIILGYIPINNSMSIKQNEFDEYVSDIKAGKLGQFNKDNDNIKIFESIISSIQVQ